MKSLPHNKRLQPFGNTVGYKRVQHHRFLTKNLLRLVANLKHSGTLAAKELRSNLMFREGVATHAALRLRGFRQSEVQRHSAPPRKPLSDRQLAPPAQAVDNLLRGVVHLRQVETLMWHMLGEYIMGIKHMKNYFSRFR
jgi:hypothetical protein